MPAYFTPDFATFLQELAQHNNREWFHSQQARYLREVKAPFEQLVASLIDHLQALDRRILTTPREAIFRIHRDTRFQADKTPYKPYVSAAIGVGGRKNPGVPGFYLELSGQGAQMYAGIYQPDKPALEAIREKIAAEPGRFRDCYTDPAFVRDFGVLRGERNKILPAALREAALAEPLLYQKAFYCTTGWPVEAMLAPEFEADILARYQSAAPLHAFLWEALAG